MLNDIRSSRLDRKTTAIEATEPHLRQNLQESWMIKRKLLPTKGVVVNEGDLLPASSTLCFAEGRIPVTSLASSQQQVEC